MCCYWPSVISARDTYQMLFDRGVPMVPKAFQLGVRIEQPQEQVNRVQYGETAWKRNWGRPITAWSPAGGRIYSPSACAPADKSFPASLSLAIFCTNGMSLSRRALPFANSGLMVTLDRRISVHPHALAGVMLQRTYEQRAFEIGGRNYSCPIQWADDFLAQRRTHDRPPSNYLRGVTPADISRPGPSAGSWPALRDGLPVLNRRWQGRFLAHATLVRDPRLAEVRPFVFRGTIKPWRAQVFAVCILWARRRLCWWNCQRPAPPSTRSARRPGHHRPIPLPWNAGKAANLRYVWQNTMQNETRFIHQPPQAMQPTKTAWRASSTICRQCRHGWMLFNVTICSSVGSLELYGEYSEAETEVFRSSSRKGTSFSMSGANLGGAHVVLCQHGGDAAARVLAFEPQQLMFQALCANMALNSLTNVYCHNVAVGAENGTIIVPPLDAHTVQNFGSLSLLKAAQGFPIEKTTLDSPESAALQFLERLTWKAWSSMCFAERARPSSDTNPCSTWRTTGPINRPN